MKNNNNGFFLTLFILTISISLICSSTIIGNPVFVYAKESFSKNSSGADTSNNNISINNNSSPQLSATPSQDCNNSHNTSACQEQHQLLLKQQPNQKQQQERPKPDNSCLFHPEQMKCKPDPITGKCPPGFSMNVYEHCFPNIPCPKGFENHDEDETGTCYPILKPNSTYTNVSK